MNIASSSTQIPPRFASRPGTAAASAAEGKPPTLRVHLTHACPIFRAGLAAILSTQPDLHVSEDEQCPKRFDEGCVVITDYAAGLRAASQQWPQLPGHPPRVLIITTRDKEWEVRQAIDCGVSGYLLQGCTPEELLRGVRQLGRGISYLSATATRSVVDSLGRATLTRRETDVLRVLAQGGSDKQIARELGIGPGTVKSHIKHLLQKLDATARTHAVVVAIERGLLSGRDEQAAPDGADGAPAAVAAPPRRIAWSAGLMLGRIGARQPASAA